MEEDGTIKQYSKKAIASLRRERRKIHRNLSGIREMSGIPGAMIVVDPGREYNAVREARKMGMAVIGLLDTDCDPEGIDIVIPGNDDALRSVRLLIDGLIESVEQGAAAHGERLASTGAAQRSDEPQPMSDEPRPTRSQTLPRPRKAATEGKAEEAKSEEPKAAEPKVEESKPAEPKPAEPKVEEPKVEEPKAVEPKAVEPEVVPAAAQKEAASKAEPAAAAKTEGEGASS
jgi:small subunit ribosomal protein S2